MENPLRGSEPDLTLIETLLWDGRALLRLDRHLARLGRSAAALGWTADLAAVSQALGRACPREPARMRVTLDAQGDIRATAGALAPTAALWRVALSDQRLDPDDPWLRLKSSRRALYDAQRAGMPAGIDEVIYANRRGDLCEGTITNLFFDLGQGLMTPPLACGLLPGILRETLLAQGSCREAVLPVAQLPQARLWVGNALRGLIPAALGATAQPDA